MTKHQEGQFVVGSDGHQLWIGTAAKTAQGAKSIASSYFHQSVGGKIEVAQVRGEQYQVVAIKHGYDKWRTAI